MQLDTQRALVLTERAHSLCFFDLEASGLRGDYNSILCISVKPFGKAPKTFSVKKPGQDRDVVLQARDYLSEFDIMCGYYSKGFDKPMINTRLLKWGLQPLKAIPHLDMYYALKSKLLTARRSQGHLLSWLETPQEKMGVSADVWAQILGNLPKYMPTMIKRCESDTKGLEALYKRTKHLLVDITS